MEETVDSITDAISDLNITADSSRNAAKKVKSEEDIHMCVVCLKRFPAHGALIKHIKNVEKANSKRICADYKEAKAELEEMKAMPHPTGKQIKDAEWNFKIALLKVTALEKY
eukprot:gene10880-12095_t